MGTEQNLSFSCVLPPPPFGKHIKEPVGRDRDTISQKTGKTCLQINERVLITAGGGRLPSELPSGAGRVGGAG